jgi:hypothetical protein
VRRFLLAVVAALLLSSCGTSTEVGVASAPRRVDKLLVFVVENHSMTQMKADMPYSFGLAQRYAYASRFYAIRHPSLPNYLAIAGGSTFGVTDDAGPGAHRVRGRSVFGQALVNGRTANVYAEGMPGRCATQDGGDRYVVRHNPWTYFIDERSACRTHDVRLRRLAADVKAGHLPNAGLVIPDACNDAHDCSLATADAWIRKRLALVMSGRDWQSRRLAVVITADEDDRRHGNRILTVVASKGLARQIVGQRLTHYSLTRLYDDVLGLPYLRKAKGAPSMTDAFGIDAGP